VNASTTIPTTVQIRRGQPIGLIVAAATLAAAITWLLVAFTLDSGAAQARQSTAPPGAVTPAAITSTGTGEWPGQPPYPPDFRGMP
jgi:hypothetical protein